MFETDVVLDSLDSWLALQKTLPVGDESAIDAIAARILHGSIVEPLTGREIAGSSLTSVGNGWREGLIYEGINSRLRAVMMVIERRLGVIPRRRMRVYAPEALTPFALRMRGLYPKFLGSEWTSDPKVRKELYPIPWEDLEALSLPTGTFDLVTTNEVLEHVPHLDRALHEIRRVLKRGGWHIGTHPFNFGAQDSLVRARVENGRIVHLAEPEYHDDPGKRGGSLVFEIPGWDILDRARNIGFSEAVVNFVVSEKHGCLSDVALGVFVTCLKK